MHSESEIMIVQLEDLQLIQTISKHFENTPDVSFEEEAKEISPQLQEVLNFLERGKGIRFSERNPHFSLNVLTRKNRFKLSVTHPEITSNEKYYIKATFINQDFGLTGFDDLIQLGGLNSKMSEFLVKCWLNNSNFIISGSSGAGKTSFLRSLMHEADKYDKNLRTVSIEEYPELNADLNSHVSLTSNDSVTLSDLIKHTLRMRPDRIIVGEIRQEVVGCEPFHCGYSLATTIHANSNESAFERLATLTPSEKEGARTVADIPDTIFVNIEKKKVVNISQSVINSNGDTVLRELIEYNEIENTWDGSTDRATRALRRQLDKITLKLIHKEPEEVALTASSALQLIEESEKDEIVFLLKKLLSKFE